MQEEFDHKIKELFADEKLEHSEAPVMLQNVFDVLDKKKKRRGFIWFRIIPGFASILFSVVVFYISYSAHTSTKHSLTRTEESAKNNYQNVLNRSIAYAMDNPNQKPISGINSIPVYSKKPDRKTYFQNQTIVIKETNKKNYSTTRITKEKIPTNNFNQTIHEKNDSVKSIITVDSTIISYEQTKKTDQPIIPSDSFLQQLTSSTNYPVDSDLTTLNKPLKQRARVEYALGFYGSLHFNSINPYTPKPVEAMDREFIDKVKNDNYIRQAFDVGLAFKLKRKHFIFETGVCYMRHDFRIDMNNSPFYPNQPIQQDGAYEFLEIPLFFGAQWNFDKWYIAPSLGVTSGWLFISENYVYKQGQFELEYQPFRRSGPVLFTPQIKFDVGYTFDQGFSFYISPFFKHHLSGEGGAAYHIPNVVFFSYSFGLRLGFNFHITRREK